MRPGRAVGVLAVDELDNVDRRDVAEIVARVGVGDGDAGRVVGVLAGDGAGVGLLAGQGGGGRRVDPGLGQVEQPVAVGVAGEAGDRPQLVVADGDVGQGHVAGVGHHVGERHRAAHGHVRPGRAVGVLAVDELDDLDGRGVAEVVGRVVVGDGGAGVGVLAGDGADVGLLPGHGGGGRRVGPGLGQVEQAVAVGVAREAGDGAQLVVADDHVGQGDVAGVGHHVGERDGAASGDVRPGWAVGVLAIDELDDLDRRRVAEVVGRVVVADGRASVGVLAGDGADVGLLAGPGGDGSAAGQGGGEPDVGPGLGQVEQAVVVGVAAGGAGDRPQLVVADHDVGQGHVAGVGHHVSEGHRAAHGHVRPGRAVSVLAVDKLDDADARGVWGVAEVVGRVVIANGGAGRVVDVLAGDGADVGLLAGQGGGGGGEDPFLGQVEQAVVVGVAGEAGDRPQFVVADDDVAQRHVAGVGDDVGERQGAAHGHQRPRRAVGVLAVDELDDLDARLVAEVVGRVVVADRRAGVGVPSGDGAGVGLLAGLGDGRLGVGPGLGQVEQAVAVGVAGEAGDRPQLVVSDRDIGQRHVAGVGHHVGEGHRAADGHVRPGRSVGIDAVDELDDVEARAADIVGRVVVGDGGSGAGILAGDGADVGLLAGQGGSGLGVGPGLGGVEQAVVVGVAGEAGDGAQLVVADDHVGQGDVARVGDHVGERHRAAHGHARPGRAVGVLAVDELDDVDTRAAANIVGRVVIGNGGAGRVVGVLGGDGADVGLLAGHGGGGLGVGPGLGQVEQAVVVGVAREAGDGAQLVVADHHVGQRHIARVGHHVGERQRAAHDDDRPGRRVGVLAVDKLDDVNRRGVAEVVGRVVVRDRRAGRVVGILGGDGAGVGLLAGQGDGRLGVGPGLGQVEQAVAVGVAGEARDRPQLVVGDHHVGQGHVARVGHHVGERQRAAGGHLHPGRRVGVLAVDVLDDVDPRRGAEVVGRVVVGDRRAGRVDGVLCGDAAGVGLLAGLGGGGLGRRSRSRSGRAGRCR